MHINSNQHICIDHCGIVVRRLMYRRTHFAFLTLFKSSYVCVYVDLKSYQIRHKRISHYLPNIERTNRFLWLFHSILEFNLKYVVVLPFRDLWLPFFERGFKGLSLLWYLYSSHPLSRLRRRKANIPEKKYSSFKNISKFSTQPKTFMQILNQNKSDLWRFHSKRERDFPSIIMSVCMRCIF